MGNHPLANDRRLDLAKFKGQSIGDVGLLAHGLTDKKLSSLTVMVREALGSQTAFRTLLHLGEWGKSPLRRFTRPFAKGIGLIVHVADGITHGHVAVLLEMRERAFWCINRDVSEIRPPKPLKLGVEVGKFRPCSNGSFEKSTPGGTFCVINATCSVSAKKLSGIRSRTRRPTGIGGSSSSRNDFGGIQHVELEGVGEGLVE